jgi:hypothetical protein
LNLYTSTIQDNAHPSKRNANQPRKSKTLHSFSKHFGPFSKAGKSDFSKIPSPYGRRDQNAQPRLGDKKRQKAATNLSPFVALIYRFNLPLFVTSDSTQLNTFNIPTPRESPSHGMARCAPSRRSSLCCGLP